VNTVEKVREHQLPKDRNSTASCCNLHILWFRDLIDVRHHDRVARPDILYAPPDRISLNDLTLQSSGCIVGERIDHHVSDPVSKSSESIPIVRKMKWFWTTLVGLARLHENKAIHDISEYVQSDLEQIQLVEEREAVVDHAEQSVGERKTALGTVGRARAP
jgi:hypothetical protein